MTNSRNSHHFDLAASSSSDFGTPTIVGTDTAFSFRKACSHLSQRIERVRKIIWKKSRHCEHAGTHLPPPGIPAKAPHPPHPTLNVMHPAPKAEKTHILKCAIGQLIIPPILHFRDLAAFIEDFNLALNHLLLTDPCHFVPRLHV